MLFKLRAFDLSIKSTAADGTFSGYGSVFNNVDSYGEIVAPGAFTASLADRAKKGVPLPVLWQHRSDSPIGIYTDLAEDDRGLRVTGKLLVDDVALAKEAAALVRAGAVSGLSIGYWVRQSSFDEKTGIRTLTKLDLEEVSLVTMPANPEARVDTIKAKLARGSLPSLPEFETILRDAGFSRTMAAKIAGHGYRSQRDAADEPDTQPQLGALVSALRGFSLPKL